MTALHDLSIADAGAKLRDGSLTSTALTEALLARIADLEPALNAFITVTADRAMADAAQADADFAAGTDKGPMQGIPYGLKDIYGTKDIRTTCHSNVLIDNVPTEDCVVEQKFKAGGGVLLGKLGTFEFALGGPAFDLPFPPARNPWNTDHQTGGSSSGSGAAIAASYMRTAMGSDTGGSIRGPAAYCGTVGIKGTYGRVSRRGVFPLSYTLDHAGPLTQSVEDAAITMQVISGHDPLDPASADVPVPDFSAGLDAGVEGLRIGYTRDFYIHNEMTNPEIIAALDATAETLAKLGAIVEEVAMPAWELFQACGSTIMSAEAYTIHEADLKTRPTAFGRYAYQRIIAGGLVSASDYINALRLRADLTAQVNDGPLATCDALLAPTGLTPANRFDEFGRDAGPWKGMLTIPYNITGNPALSVPIGFSANGLPLGCQIVGKPFDETMCFRIGAALEGALALTQRPDLAPALAAE
ncbi:MAG: Asp-tRNA(Asn)/Glu-tRNA(Gln) amidotransferase GatCAB subunit A [Rhodobacteraceae bacterium]|nr:Asp-tRNA(Asn)/Glu-tRNA(Gln) amidotransferase GatCAB subunit A [Paracoccaceae bacterium]